MIYYNIWKICQVSWHRDIIFTVLPPSILLNLIFPLSPIPRLKKNLWRSLSWINKKAQWVSIQKRSLSNNITYCGWTTRRWHVLSKYSQSNCNQWLKKKLDVSFLCTSRQNFLALHSIPFTKGKMCIMELIGSPRIMFFRNLNFFLKTKILYASWSSVILWFSAILST